ncbi:hypothetical protein KUTeg_001302 [Tegillarca granosa]|uniref:SCP domain-containing protein n=1 Tax=Tegillarca granosa TaxID=220873 RepID=A0ABQ9FYV6_TEGGR|nr:hypothetical protein KUTeg_001302 [Tegillarca granosa]
MIEQTAPTKVPRVIKYFGVRSPQEHVVTSALMRNNFITFKEPLSTINTITVAFILSYKFAMSNSKKFIEEIIKAHNEYREKHQAPPLRHSAELTSEAQRWADHLAATNTFQHSNAKIGGERLGENIAMKWSSKPDSYTDSRLYDLSVVWKGSREIGIGRSQTSDGKILIVTNYRPTGNVIGQYSLNVLPPKDGKITLPANKALCIISHN